MKGFIPITPLNDKDHINLFLDYLNQQNPSIKFTSEIEDNNKLAFLDILISKSNNDFTTSTYRKPTFTGLGLNFSSFTPILYKINNIKCLLYRAYHICSSYISIAAEFEFLTQYFLNNGYKRSVIDKQIKFFLNLIFNSEPTDVPTVQKHQIFIKFPFYGNSSFKFRKKLVNLIKINFPQLSPQVIFTNPYTIKSFFHFKDSVETPMRSSLIYKYRCDCNVTYIGATNRHLKTRISEHLGVSSRTNLALSNPPFSSIRQHCEQNNHTLKSENFQILTNCRNPLDRFILESILIKQYKPELNSGASVDLRTL